MLDLKTVLVVNLVVAAMQAFIWICAWRAWRDLIPLKYLAGGFSFITLGVLFMILRGAEPGPVAIVIHNVTIKIGLVLLAEGLGRFLGQPSRKALYAGLLIAYTAFWAGSVHFDPGNVALRIHSSTLFTVVLMCLMSGYLARDRSQPRVLRWATIAVLAGYMLSSILQSVIEFRLPTDFQSASILADRHAWYLLIGTLFLISFFTCLLFMVGTRLSADLRHKNISLVREVQKRGILEKQLGASLEAERNLREDQANFMRIVGHEFRTPLAVIRNAVDMISLSPPPPIEMIAARHAKIHDSLDHMFQLLDRFLGSDREARAHPDWTRCGAVFSELQLHFEMIGQSPRLRFHESPEDLWLHVDHEMLETALINLIDNALKYSPPEKPVEISAEADAHDLRILIRDHGIGIPEAERHKIGRRFFRASNAPAGLGTGLGLNLSRRLLASQRGRLDLAPSPEGSGTVATVTLPLPIGPAPAISEEEFA